MIDRRLFLAAIVANLVTGVGLVVSALREATPETTTGPVPLTSDSKLVFDDAAANATPLTWPCDRCHWPISAPPASIYAVAGEVVWADGFHLYIRNTSNTQWLLDCRSPLRDA